MRKVVLLYNPRLTAAEPFARDLARQLEASSSVQTVVASVWDEDTVRATAPGAEFAVTLGGDGTVLRAARLVAPLGLPLVGVNLGKLGFLTELGRREAARKLPMFVGQNCWVEERILLSVQVERRAKLAQGDWTFPGEPRVETYLAVNEVVAGRAALARAVDITITIDDTHLANYIADGVIVSTPTGSTAYSLAAGGPILHPQLENLILTPILPHLASAYPLVCPPGVVIRIEVTTGHQAGLTIDGQIEGPLYNGDLLELRAAPQRVRFLRAQVPTYFYQTLANRLRRESQHDLTDASEERVSRDLGDVARSQGRAR
ncbi:MAG: NAD(+)/NADH kinase [Chloroflexi bacterium]|nr:NAD(+)/NADH kinase [Chloroflexota bacterium]